MMSQGEQYPLDLLRPCMSNKSSFSQEAANSRFFSCTFERAGRLCWSLKCNMQSRRRATPHVLLVRPGPSSPERIITWSNSITVTDLRPLRPSSLPAAALLRYCAHLSRPASRGGVAKPRRPLAARHCNILIWSLSRQRRRIFFPRAPLGLDAGRIPIDDLTLFLLQEYPTSLKWPEGGSSYRQQYYNCTLSAL